MTHAPLLVLLAAAAIWPFGRDRDKSDEPTGTIKDLERSGYGATLPHRFRMFGNVLL